MGVPLHTRIFIGMLAGLALGLAARLALGTDPLLPWLVQNVAAPLGQVFLRGVFMVVVPLVVAALALGVAEIGDVGKVGRIGLKTLALTLLFSGFAVLIGVAAVNVFQPGAGLGEAERQVLMGALTGEEVQTKVAQAAQAKPIAQSLVELIPKNPFAEAVNAFEGGLLPLMVFALVLGVAMAAVEPARAAPLKAFLESVYAVMLQIIDFAMILAPFGVAGLMFSVSATLGLDALWLLGKYVLVVIGALAFHQFVIYGLGVKLIARRDPVRFFKDLREVMLTAFSTSSSAVTLPTALLTATEKLHLPKKVSHFVLTVGATANQNGTALYEGITVLFLAQLFGVHLEFGQQVTVVLLSVMAGVGTAGVPGGSLPMIVIVLNTIGVPGAAIGIILGVDRILDMSRTVLNVSGDLTIATCVAALEPADEHPGTPDEPAVLTASI
jgi:DAACS family dicarboxylate/amino acid:cation (Na+ or H+) symporter